jgi:hypothetical protein
VSELVANCPRCGAEKITFDLIQENFTHIRYDWQYWFEAFCVCRNCKKVTIFILAQTVDSDKEVVHHNGIVNLNESVNRYMRVEGYINLKNNIKHHPPEYIPRDIKAAFREGEACMSIGCFNAAGTMFRLCVDFASRSLLPEDDVNGLNSRIKRSLGLRLSWLFDNGILPEALRELSLCVKDDGNDGAHEGTLSEEDTEDLLDFTSVLLERIYTEPERLRLAKQRREKHRSDKQ